MLTAAELLLLGLTALFLVFVLAHTATGLVIYRDAPTRTPTDISSRREPVPAEVAPLADDLRRLGFTRLGEAELVVPSTSLLGPFQRRQDRHVVWIFVDAASTTYAELVPVGPLVSLTTYHSDGSVVETMYPRGERIDTPDFYSGHVTTTLAEAYDTHRRVVDRRTRGHGPAGDVHSMGDYLRLEMDFRRRFATRKLRGPVLRNVVLPALVVVGLALLVVASVVGTR